MELLKEPQWLKIFGLVVLDTLVLNLVVQYSKVNITLASSNSVGQELWKRTVQKKALMVKDIWPTYQKSSSPYYFVTTTDYLISLPMMESMVKNCGEQMEQKRLNHARN